jgi:hypothetical protein
MARRERLRSLLRMFRRANTGVTLGGRHRRACQLAARHVRIDGRADTWVYVQQQADDDARSNLFPRVRITAVVGDIYISAERRCVPLCGT